VVQRPHLSLAVQRVELTQEPVPVRQPGTQRLLQDAVTWRGFYITAGFGVYGGGELDARGSCHYSGPATAPDTESCLDYADDIRSSSDGPPASPFSSQAISSGVSAAAPASTLALNSSPVLQPTSAKISSG
jgi:hypothetical protein